MKFFYKILRKKLLSVSIWVCILCYFSTERGTVLKLPWWRIILCLLFMPISFTTPKWRNELLLQNKDLLYWMYGLLYDSRQMNYVQIYRVLESNRKIDGVILSRNDFFHAYEWIFKKNITYLKSNSSCNTEGNALKITILYNKTLL